MLILDLPVMLTDLREAVAFEVRRGSALGLVQLVHLNESEAQDVLPHQPRNVHAAVPVVAF